MSNSSGRLADALRRAQPVTDGKLYTMISLDLEALPQVAQVLTEEEAFQAMLVDSREVTLILPETRWEMLAGTLTPREVSTGWRLITFDAALAHDLVGFMATISGELAQLGISLMAFSAYQRDHILVPAVSFEKAWVHLTDMSKHTKS
jgi:hypothetical protein